MKVRIEIDVINGDPNRSPDKILKLVEAILTSNEMERLFQRKDLDLCCVYNPTEVK